MRLHDYASPPAPRTSSSDPPPTGPSRIAAALASSSVVHAVRGPPLAVKLIAGRGARASGRSGLDARMPPAAGVRGRTPGQARFPGGCLETADDRGDARQPGLIQRTRFRLAAGPPERRGGAGQCEPGSPWRRSVRLPGASVPCPAVTLSDRGGLGERTRSRRYLASHDGLQELEARA